LNDINVVVGLIGGGVCEDSRLAILGASIPLKSALEDLDLLIVLLTSSSLKHLELKNGGFIGEDSSET
jgi:hypothetical protein